MYMRIRFIRQVGEHKAGDVRDINGTEAQHLVSTGMAELSKDMTANDYKSKGVKRGNVGNVRPNKRK